MSEVKKLLELRGFVLLRGRPVRNEREARKLLGHHLKDQLSVLRTLLRTGRPRSQDQAAFR
jgi:hypothetical protein